MRNNKFFIGFMFVLIIGLIFLAGCSSNNDEGSNNNNGSNDTSGSGEEVTIDIFQFKVEVKDQLEALVKQYEDEHPNVSINVKTVGGGNDYGASLKAAFASGEEPDIFNIGGPSDLAEYRDNLADVSDTKAVEEALDGVLATVQEGDEIVGLPSNQEGYGLIYNKRILDGAGINPDEILTYDDLEKAVESLDSQKEDLGIEAVFALPGKEAWVLGDHIANMFIAPEFNNDINEAYVADTIPFEKSDEFKRYIDLQNQYSVQPVLSLDYSQQVEQLFSLEDVAFIQQGNWVYNSIYDMDPDLAENNIGIMPVPVEGFEGKIPAGVPMYWAVNSESDDNVVQASKDFLDWMYTSEEGKTAVLEELKFIPAYKNYDASKIADPLSQIIYEYAEAGDTIEGWVYSAAPTGWTQEVLGANIQKYLGDAISWEEALDNSREKWEAERE